MNNRSYFHYISFIMLSVVLVACATAPGGGMLFYSGTPGPSDVRIEVNATSISTERQAAFLKQGGAKRIATGITAELKSNVKKLGSGVYTIKITITKFRLRSTATGFWFGTMAGTDTIGADVVVESEGKIVQSFSTEASAVLAGFIRPGETNRFVLMIEELSQQIVEKF